jgi:hypothetical protein
MSIYGDIVTGEEVSKKVIEFIQRWSPAYIAEIGRRNEFNGKNDDGTDQPTLSPFMSFAARAQEDKNVEEQTPACTVVVPGLADEPRRAGDGKHSAKWAAAVLIIVSGRDEESTARGVRLYCAAVRAMFVQHPDIDGFASSTDWVDEDYDALDFENSRTLQGGRVDLVIEVNAVVDSAAGPIEPPDDPTEDPGDFDRFQTTNLTTRRLQW